MARIELYSKDRIKPYVLVDDDMVEELSKYRWTWRVGYAVARMKDENGGLRDVLMHRYITGAKPGELVDHINRIRSDNRRSNLRLVTPQQNSWNASKRGDFTSSDYRGVSRVYDTDVWVACIQVDGVRVDLGRYTDEQEAAYVYDQAAMQLRGEYANLNFEY